jgi:hypothetical protein
MIGLPADHPAKAIKKKPGIRVAKEWANNKVKHYSKNRSQKIIVFEKKMLEHKESSSHKTALKLLAETKKNSYLNLNLNLFTFHKS